MAQTPVWQGNKDIQLQGDYPQWEFATSGTRCTLVYEGQYTQLLANKPLPGGLVTTFELYPVSKVSIQRFKSGKGRMTVMLENVQPIQDTFSTPIQPVYELDWTQLEKPIEQSNNFRGLFYEPASLAAMRASHSLLAAWENAADAATKEAAFDDLANIGKGGSALLQQLAVKKARGEVSFIMPAPVARITTQSFYFTGTTTMGLLVDSVPGFPGTLPSKYQWLGTADRSTRTGVSGRWQRVQEWTGAESWDVDLYPATPTTPPNSGPLS